MPIAFYMDQWKMGDVAWLFRLEKILQPSRGMGDVRELQE